MTAYPCTRECKERYPGCHDHCEKYQTIKEKNLKEHDKIVKEKAKDKRADAAKFAGYKRMEKNSGNSIFGKSHKK